jgi:ABC-type ATPase with predicted acetyltransferase domain
MAVYEVERSYPWAGAVTERVGQVCRMFGVTLDRLRERAAVHRCRVEMGAGQVVCIAGPSGAGKSVLLRELQGAVPAGQAVNLGQIPLAEDRAVIDCFEGEVVGTIRLLSAVGLGDVFCLLNRPSRLSEGQQYRFRLARAMAMGRAFVFADEFASGLDRVTAAAVAFQVRRFASRTGTTFVVAACRDDILADLSPDVLVVKDFSGEAEVIYRCTNSDL